MTVVDEIRAVAVALGVDPNLAVADATVESGLNPYARGDQGTSVGLFQLHWGGELNQLGPNFQTAASYAEVPSLNAQVALSQFAAVEKANPNVHDPGMIAAMAQRPANPSAYAAAVDRALGSAGLATSATVGVSHTSGPAAPAVAPTGAKAAQSSNGFVRVLADLDGLLNAKGVGQLNPLTDAKVILARGAIVVGGIIVFTAGLAVTLSAFWGRVPAPVRDVAAVTGAGEVADVAAGATTTEKVAA